MELGDLTLLRKIKISGKHTIWQWLGLTNQILLKVEIHVMSSQKKAEIRHKEYEQNNEASPVMCHVLMSCECYDTHVLFNNPHQLWETSTSSTELLLLFVFHNELTASTHNEAVVLLSCEVILPRTSSWPRRTSSSTFSSWLFTSASVSSCKNCWSTSSSPATPSSSLVRICSAQPVMRA